MANNIVYNFLYENELIGHVLENDDSRVLVPVSDTSIVPVAESFGFDGPAWYLEEGEYKLITLSAATELKPIYEFKVINLSDYLLLQEETSE